ncbi:S41 family peptidase [Vagococcus bubulae]|uniref:Tail specific protease domain-containing protein n=1 Tax=Vagococcus bubulae TaxID=1977868 RepID=A0A429ZLN3_9ENTE|nr:S41 family peptidase [Vagococcus bubulae]RST94614.1 hypothetical protein CBF36_05255 [Vagococcus bubulae]
MENRLADVSTIYHSALNLFPYWTSKELEKWKQAYLDTIKKTLLSDSLPDFYHLLCHFTAKLDDGHTMIYLPKEFKTDLVYPVMFNMIENQLVIVKTTEEYQHYLYLPIKKVNGLSVSDFLTEINSKFWFSNGVVSLYYYQNYLFFFHLNQLLIEFSSNDSLVLSPQNKETVVWVQERMNKEIVIETDAIIIIKEKNKILIKLNHFLEQEIVTVFYQYMNLYKESDEIIFDLRGNMGGNSGIANDICAAFFEETFETELSFYQVLDAQRYASGTQLYYKRDIIDDNDYTQTLTHQYFVEEIDKETVPKNKGQLLNKPVTIIQNRQTYSSAENFVMNFYNRPNTRIIGTYSAGSTGQPALIPLETGGTFMVTAKGVRIPNGRVIA